MFDRPGIACWSVAFSPDGARLITGTKDGQLTLWDAETGRETNRVQRATGGEFLSAAFTPNGRWVVSAGEDCAVRVLDAATLETMHTFRRHRGPIRCMAISSGGSVLATGSTDTTVKLWRLEALERGLEK